MGVERRALRPNTSGAGGSNGGGGGPSLWTGTSGRTWDPGLQTSPPGPSRPPTLPAPSPNPRPPSSCSTKLRKRRGVCHKGPVRVPVGTSGHDGQIAFGASGRGQRGTDRLVREQAATKTKAASLGPDPELCQNTTHHAPQEGFAKQPQSVGVGSKSGFIFVTHIRNLHRIPSTPSSHKRCGIFFSKKKKDFQCLRGGCQAAKIGWGGVKKLYHFFMRIKTRSSNAGILGGGGT